MKNVRRNLDVCELPLGGTHLIEASAGTGKTYTITSLVLRFLLEEALPLESIVAVTFTNAATSELKERINQRIEIARQVVGGAREPDGDQVMEYILSLPNQERILRLLEVAVRDADAAAVFTIHGFAARMLKDYAFESGNRDDLELIGDQRSLIHDVVTDFWSTRVATLCRDSFDAVGGSSFYSALLQVGAGAAAAFEVPLVLRGESRDLSEEQRNFDSVFVRVQGEFNDHGRELLEILSTSPALNRNMMRVETLQADHSKYCAYFRQEHGRQGFLGSERFTSTKVLSSLKKNGIAPEHDLLTMLEELMLARARLKESQQFFADDLRVELCKLVLERVQIEHERAGTQSFDGLLVDLCSALRKEGSGAELAKEIRKKMPVALIDEFQDTDPAQYEIFQRIYGERSKSRRGGMYLIGDPKQSIYAFRGADVQTYLKAAQDAQGGVWTLGTSFRASPSLVAAQNALFQRSDSPFAMEGIVYEPVVPRPDRVDELKAKTGMALPGIELVFCEGMKETQWVNSTANEVAKFIRAGHFLGERVVTPGDIAVLTRSNGRAQEMQLALQKLGVPAVLQGDRNVLGSEEALELRRVLRALAEPSQRKLVRTALSTRLLGLRADELLAIDDEFELLESWTGKLRKWGELWSSRGIAHALEALHASENTIARTLRAVDGERRMTNFRHLLEVLHEAQISKHLGVAGLLRWLDEAIADPSADGMGAESYELRLETDANAVTLLTSHKSKGLEYNIVFLPDVARTTRPFSEEVYRFFDPEVGHAFLEIRSKETREETSQYHEVEGRQEALRLAYVAFTRAKHHVVAICGENSGFSALNYLIFGSPDASEEDKKPPKKSKGKVNNDERLKVLDDLSSLSQGAIRWRMFSDEEVFAVTNVPSTCALVPPLAVPQLAERERTSSFSSMTRGAHAHLSRAAQEGRDIDESIPGTEGDQRDGNLVEVSASAGEAPGTCTRAVLADFPRGARPGDALHALFEYSPFAEGTAEERSEVVTRELQKRGFSDEHLETARLSLEDVLRVDLAVKSPLDADQKSFTLGDLMSSDRSCEMEFSLPVGDLHNRLSPSSLARSLGHEVHAGPGGKEGRELLSAEYLRNVSELPFSAWSGFLRGFMDLVFVVDDKLYGVDYKSNYLGEFYEDYTETAMHEAMEGHHYLIQALIYAVAIHRYGKERIADYTYQKNFGGMRYLFLRGMHPAQGQSGVYAFCPPESLVESLSQALELGK